MKRKILIIDDHPISRRGLAQLISLEDDLEICGEAGTALEGIEAIQKLTPDLVLCDITLPDKSGLELIKDVRVLLPETLILVLSMHDEALYAERVLRAGGRGYVMKEAAPENLILAIRKVLDGGIYVSDAMSSRLLEILSGQRQRAAADPLQRLTDRELDVFKLIGQGRANRDIAQHLCISVRTVDAHRAHLKEKLGIRDGNELVRYAVRWVETGEV
jgi:DNA-binding NarL/FixJ family response regulator